MPSTSKYQHWWPPSLQQKNNNPKPRIFEGNEEPNIKSYLFSYFFSWLLFFRLMSLRKCKWFMFSLYPFHLNNKMILCDCMRTIAEKKWISSVSRSCIFFIPHEDILLDYWYMYYMYMYQYLITIDILNYIYRFMSYCFIYLVIAVKQTLCHAYTYFFLPVMVNGGGVRLSCHVF